MVILNLVYAVRHRRLVVEPRRWIVVANSPPYDSHIGKRGACGLPMAWWAPYMCSFELVEEYHYYLSGVPVL